MALSTLYVSSEECEPLKLCDGTDPMSEKHYAMYDDCRFSSHSELVYKCIGLLICYAAGNICNVRLDPCIKLDGSHPFEESRVEA